MKSCILILWTCNIVNLQINSNTLPCSRNLWTFFCYCNGIHISHWEKYGTRSLLKRQILCGLLVLIFVEFRLSKLLLVSFHGPVSFNSSFFFREKGAHPRFQYIETRTTVLQHPELNITRTPQHNTQQLFAPNRERQHPNRLF